MLFVCAARGAFTGQAHLIVTLREPYAYGSPYQDFLSQYSLDSKFGDALHGMVAVRTRSAMSLKLLRDNLENDPRVKSVDRDELVLLAEIPNDSLFPKQWAFRNDENPDVSIDGVRAWQLSRGSRRIIVAINDTGVDYLHPDLVANIWHNPREIPGNNRDDDGNGFVDDVHGYDFSTNDANPMDRHSHGTHVAGIVGAETSNGIGVAGVCPRVSLMAVKVLSDGGSGYTSDIIAGMYYAVDNGARVINASYGGGGYQSATHDALEYARKHNVIFVGAAGNFERDNDIDPFYPASYDNANVVSVGASWPSAGYAPFSHYGKHSVDLFAPGTWVVSTTIEREKWYLSKTGSSMAAPFVTGTLALLISFIPHETYDRHIALLLGSVHPLPELADKCVTGGHLDVYQCLKDAVPHSRTVHAAMLVKQYLASRSDF